MVAYAQPQGRSATVVGGIGHRVDYRCGWCDTRGVDADIRVGVRCPGDVPFGALLVIGALFHFYVLAISYRPVALPPWLYAVPLLLLGAGVYELYNFGVQNDSLTNIITGSGLVVFAIGVFLESYFIGVHNKAVNKPSRVQHNEPQVEDVSHTEIRTLDDPQK